MEKIKEFLARFFLGDFVLKIISFLLAVIVWAVVSISIYPSIDRTIVNVPVEIDLDGSYAQATSLEVTGLSDKTVTVSIQGQRGKIGELSAEDLVATVDISTVMVAKTYSLGMDVKAVSGDKSFTITSITPSTVDVTFDKIVSKEFPLEAKTEGLKLETGYTAGDPVVVPETVTATGPQNIINSITRAVVNVNINSVLSSTHEFTSNEIILYNDNAVISNEDNVITFDRSSYQVQIPVFVRQTLPLDVNIINAPENLDLDYFRSLLKFSAEEIDIAAPNDKVKEMESLIIGNINMREVDVGSVFEFSTENFLPAEYENLSLTDTVTVTCSSEGLTRRPIALQARNIQYINKPANFEFSTTASGLSLVFVGDETQLAELSSADITAQIDLIDFDKQEGEHKMAVDIVISSYNRVWCIGNGSIATPKIIVNAQYVPEETAVEESR